VTQKNKIQSTRCRCDGVTKTAMYFAIHEVPFTWRNAIRRHNIKECAFFQRNKFQTLHLSITLFGKLT